MIEYGVQPADGGNPWLYGSRKSAERAVERSGGEVVHRVDRGPWQRAADMVVVDRADVVALLDVLRAFHGDSPNLDGVMLEAQRGIIERVSRAVEAVER